MNEIKVIGEKFLASSAKSFFKTQQQGERILAGFYYEVAKNPKIMSCTQSSIFLALHKSAQYDLNAGARQECCYIPRKQKDGTMALDFMPMVAGLIKIAFNTGVYKIICEVIHENDFFEIDQGTAQRVTFQKNFKEDRGIEVGAYAEIYYRTKAGEGSLIETLTKKDIYAIQKVSRTQEIWQGDFRDEMIRKSAIKRALKRCPNNESLIDVISIDNEVTNQNMFQKPRELGNPFTDVFNQRKDNYKLVVPPTTENVEKEEDVPDENI